MSPQGMERMWAWLHGHVNVLAWRFCGLSNPRYRIDDTKFLWRVNRWLSDRYVPAMIQRHIENQQRKEETD